MGAPEPFDPRELIHRVGTFFLLIGIGLLVFFTLSESVRQVNFNYLCWSTVLLTLGFMFRTRYKKPIPASGRFGWMKKLFKGKKE